MRGQPLAIARSVWRLMFGYFVAQNEIGCTPAGRWQLGSSALAPARRRRRRCRRRRRASGTGRAATRSRCRRRRRRACRRRAARPPGWGSRHRPRSRARPARRRAAGPRPRGEGTEQGQDDDQRAQHARCIGIAALTHEGRTSHVAPSGWLAMIAATWLTIPELVTDSRIPAGAPYGVLLDDAALNGARERLTQAGFGSDRYDVLEGASDVDRIDLKGGAHGRVGTIMRWLRGTCSATTPTRRAAIQSICATVTSSLGVSVGEDEAAKRRAADALRGPMPSLSTTTPTTTSRTSGRRRRAGPRPRPLGRRPGERSQSACSAAWARASG